MRRNPGHCGRGPAVAAWFAAVAALLPGVVSAAPHRKAPAVAAPPILATGTLDNAGLVWIALSAAEKPTDPFAQAPTAKYAGRTFRVVLPIDRRTPETEQGWEYDLSKKSVHISMFAAETFRLRYTSKPVGSYVGSNSFGVKRRVTSYVAVEVSLTAKSQPEIAWYETAFTAEPERARLATKDLELVIEGRLVTGPDGAVASCSRDRAGATLDDPTDFTTESCTVQAAIERVSIKEIHADNEIAAWPIPPPATK